MMVLYTRDENGLYSGSYAYYDKFLEFTGGGSATSFEEMHADCFISLEVAVEGCTDIPFSINNIKESVAFDFLQCYDEDELDKAHNMRKTGSTLQAIAEALQK